MKIFEFYEDDKFIYIVNELLTGGELFDILAQKKHFEEKQASQYIREILSAVNYCHQNNIIHR